MKIALHQTGEVGDRAGRILLGDRRVEVIGILDRDPSARSDRIERAVDLAEYDVVVTDDTDPQPIIARAADAGRACVVWVETEVPVREDADTTLLVGSNLASGLAPCLASHEVARADSNSSVSIAWTEPGTPLRTGEALAFPDPVGGRWGRRHHGASDAFVAPVTEEWAGAIARVTSAENGGRITRIVGVADLAPHLEGMALAAGALAVGSGAYTPGLHLAVDAAESYLAEALKAGLDVAAHSMTAD